MAPKHEGLGPEEAGGAPAATQSWLSPPALGTHEKQQFTACVPNGWRRDCSPGLLPQTSAPRGQPGRAGTGEIPEGLVTGPRCGGSNDQIKYRSNNRIAVSAPQVNQVEPADGSRREREGGTRWGPPKPLPHPPASQPLWGPPVGHWHESPEPCGQEVRAGLPSARINKLL